MLKWAFLGPRFEMTHRLTNEVLKYTLEAICYFQPDTSVHIVHSGLIKYHMYASKSTEIKMSMSDKKIDERVL